MATYPDKFDWLSKAKVPSPLTLENHQLQINKSKDWNKKIKDKLKERDKIKSENEKLILQNQVDSKRKNCQKNKRKRQRLSNMLIDLVAMGQEGLLLLLLENLIMLLMILICRNNKNLDWSVNVELELLKLDFNDSFFHSLPSSSFL
ncbi:hypothetical protein KEM48_013185 [Puccinia striiformis f. sp. tritici PST-130]|nr:hypothetical protein KEM48_013185 [Puccinia striiformis f. sp. tritici PST-130]